MAGDESVFDPRAALAELAEQRAAERLEDNWRDHYQRLDAPRRAWADLLMRQRWHWFCTLTFKPAREGRRHGGVHPEAAGKSFGLLVAQLNEDLYGKRWRQVKRAEGGLVWACGTEFHKDGRIHFHSLLACSQVDLNAVARRLSWMDWWRDRFGFARIEPPQSNEDVCGYVSKYVTKQGEVDFSQNFGATRPPPLLEQPFALGFEHRGAPGAQIWGPRGLKS